MKKIKTITTIGIITAIVGFFTYSLAPKQAKPEQESLIQQELKSVKRVIIVDNFSIEQNGSSEWVTLIGTVVFDSSYKYTVGEKYEFINHTPSKRLPSQAIIFGYEESLSSFKTRFLYDDICRHPEDNKMHFNEIKILIDKWHKMPTC